MGRATWDALGTIIDGGDDLNAPGLTSYMFDVTYVTWFVQVGVALISDVFWWIYMVIPLFAVYKLFSLLMGFRSSMGGGMQDETDSTSSLSKTQLKKQKRGEKVKYMHG